MSKMKKSTSPTQRSLKKLRSEGYLCAITEHWNAFAHIRQDLFGFIDILAVKGKETLGVQTTIMAGHVPEHIRKIKAHKNYPIIKKSNIKIVVHGWRKLKTGWECKEVKL